MEKTQKAKIDEVPERTANTSSISEGCLKGENEPRRSVLVGLRLWRGSSEVNTVWP